MDLDTQIRWDENQPNIAQVKPQILSSQLIPDLVSLVDKHGLRKAQAIMMLEDQSGENLYLISVGTSPKSDHYEISIQSSQTRGVYRVEASGELPKAYFRSD